MAGAPIALTIAGSDSSGGAGIQADLKTFAALNVYGAAVLTALTAQNTQGVQGVLAVPPDFIAQQISSVAGDLRIGAVKTGMLGDTATVRAVVVAVGHYKLRPLVVDPVMVATSGDVLLAPDAIAAVRSELLPLADVLTPNLHEAAQLTAQQLATNEDGMIEQARLLMGFGARAVLIKGGHAVSENAIDLLVSEAGTQRLVSPRLHTRHTHGTGCTLSAALAAGLAQGLALDVAARQAKQFVWAALQAGQLLGVGRGNGPLDHRVTIIRP